MQSPFIRVVLDEPMPNRFKKSQIELYDGSTDPLDHLAGYCTLMTMQKMFDVLLYLTFLETLWKAARIEFYGLQLDSVCPFQ